MVVCPIDAFWKAGIIYGIDNFHSLFLEKQLRIYS
jgi:hypothetical protein